jgi:hypothetical protein
VTPAAVRRFATIAARTRAAVWPCTVKLADLSTVAVAKSATKLERTQNETGSGWVQRALATFNFPATGAFIPAIGGEWEITVSELVDEVGTRWRCFDLTRSAAGTEHRCTCFRLD